MPDQKTRGQIVREVSTEWMKAGKLHVPPDDTSSDDDAPFWAEVEKRVAAAKEQGSE